MTKKKPIHSPTGCWQDFDQQIPAINDGDPVAVMKQAIGGEIMTAPDLASRPYLSEQSAKQLLADNNDN